MNTKELLKEIRVALRLAMNGVVSTSMREKGVAYKLNFGVALPKIKAIALHYPKNALLADALWCEEVREMKILATLLQPADHFPCEKAEAWAKEVKHLEIAEAYCVNLLQDLPFAPSLVLRWLKEDEGYCPIMGFILFARLCAKDRLLVQQETDFVLAQAKKTLDQKSDALKPSALLALKRYGRRGKQEAETVWRLVSDYHTSDSPEKQEYLADLKFEFEYYS